MRDKNTNFSISGGAQSSPVLPTSSEFTIKSRRKTKLNVEIIGQDIWVDIDKEWANRLLEEYRQHAADDYRNVQHQIHPESEEFLSYSEVWNG